MLKVFHPAVLEEGRVHKFSISLCTSFAHLRSVHNFVYMQRSVHNLSQTGLLEQSELLTALLYGQYMFTILYALKNLADSI